MSGKEFDARYLSEDERKGLLKAIHRDLAALEKKHGEGQVRWAYNKTKAKRNRKRAIEQQRREHEDELRALEQT